MTDLRKAAEMLMKALDDGWVERGDNVVIALRQALAQPEQPMSPEHLPRYVATNGVKPMEGGGGGGSQPEPDWTTDTPIPPFKYLDLPEYKTTQPEQSVEPPDYVEPITFDYHDGWEEGFKAGVESIQNKKGLTPSNVSPVLHGGDKNYTELAQPEQEPVAWLHPDKKVDVIVPSKLAWFDKPIPLYTAPIKREWVGLTDEEMFEAMDTYDDLENARKIEAKLKDKNT